jgi:hypothetical protein
MAAVGFGLKPYDSLRRTKTRGATKTLVLQLRSKLLKAERQRSPLPYGVNFKDGLLSHH